jgi:hypothetical protein
MGRIQYERLDDYYIFYGLIGHKKNVCLAPQILIPPEKYDISLRTSTYINLRMVNLVHQEDSNSSISLAASVGNSLGNVEPTQLQISQRQKKS